MPDESLTRLERACQLFTRHAVEFLVIDGQAEYLFGSPRITFDVDFCYRRTEETLERLSRALIELRPTLRGAPKDLPFRIDARSLALGNNYTFDSDFGPLDSLGWVEPVGDYDEIAIHAEKYRVGDLDVRTISLYHLIRVKEHLRRLKDRDSLFQLKAIKQLRAEQNPLQ